MISGKKVGNLVKKYMRVEPMQVGSVGDTRGYTNFKHWSRKASISSRSSSRGSSRSRETGRGYDSDYWDDDAPADVPEGSLAVYVGPKMRRFVIQTSYLYKQVFRDLLRKSEEEYGFETEGGLRIACETEVFEELLWRLESGRETDESF